MKNLSNIQNGRVLLNWVARTELSRSRSRPSGKEEPD